MFRAVTRRDGVNFPPFPLLTASWNPLQTSQFFNTYIIYITFQKIVIKIFMTGALALYFYIYLYITKVEGRDTVWIIPTKKFSKPSLICWLVTALTVLHIMNITEKYTTIHACYTFFRYCIISLFVIISLYLYLLYIIISLLYLCTFK